MLHEKLDEKNDQRRRHSHFLATIIYIDDEVFTRVYSDIAKAEKFAARQEKSPTVKSTRVQQIS